MARQVTVTRHAVIRARARFQGRNDRWLADEIEREVRDALAHGRLADHKPKWLRLWGRTSAAVGAGQRVVWDAAEQHAWIVVREGETWTVITSLNRTVAREMAA